jgi:hypothetical protein
MEPLPLGRGCSITLRDNELMMFMNQTGKIKVLEAIRQGQVGGGETHILNLVE